MKRLPITPLLAAAAVLFAGTINAGADPSGTDRAAVSAAAADTSASAASGVSSPVPGRPEFRMAAENASLRLFVVESGENAGEFCVQNKGDRTVWYSNPQRRFSNTQDGGAAKTEAYSQLLLTVYDGAAKAEETLNSFSGTMRGQRVKVERVEKGVRVLYIFDDERIAVPLTLTLDGAKLEASVKTADIVEGGDNRLLALSVLPYFGCSDASGGYTLVPDGSGAIIRDNNGKSRYANYEQAVYGGDAAFRQEKRDTFTQQAFLPVFGRSGADGAMLAEIEDGAAAASVKAFVSGMRNSYNTVYPAFTLRAKDDVIIGDPSAAKSVSNTQYDFSDRLAGVCSVRYGFLPKGSGYAGMAEQYRRDLGLKLSASASEQPPLFLTLYGGVRKQQSFLGLPMMRLQKLTTVGQAQQIVRAFADVAQGGVYVDYRYLDSALLNGKAQNRLRIQSGLGTEAQLRELRQLAGGRLYLDFDGSRVTRGGNGFNRYFDTAKRIGHDAVTVPFYKVSTYYPDPSVRPAYALRPDKLSEIAGRYIASVRSKGFDVGFSALGSRLYTDFSEGDFSSREDSLKTFRKTLRSAGGRCLVNAPNAYALSAAGAATDVPAFSSDFDIEDDSVPFYELVLSGCRDYAVESVNLSDDVKSQFLKAVETGASLQFSFVYQNASALQDTELSGLYGSDFAVWRSRTAQMQRELETVFSRVGSRWMTGSEILADGVRLSRFEGGRGVVVNYTDKPAATAYGSVAPASYRVVG